MIMQRALALEQGFKSERKDAFSGVHPRARIIAQERHALPTTKMHNIVPAPAPRERPPQRDARPPAPTTPKQDNGKSGCSAPYRGGRQNQTTQRFANKDVKVRGSKSKTCYACEQEGHFAKDTVYPLYSLNKDRAAETLYHIVDNDDSEDSKDPEEPDNGDPWGGSQFEEDAADGDIADTLCNNLVDETVSDQPQAGMMRTGDWEDVRAYGMRDTEDSCPDSDCESVADSEDEYVLDYGEFLQTMEVDETRDVHGKRGYVPMLDPVPSHNPHSLKHPRRTDQEKQCLAVFLEVNGYKAFTLCNSGCTTELMSHDFAHLVQPELFELDEPITIQLGTKGSRSQIIYGTFAPFLFNSGKIAIAGHKYFDIANIDCYDIVVGTSFMRRHKISLDFEYNVVHVKGQPMPTLLEQQELQEIARHYLAGVQPKKKLEGLVVPTKPSPTQLIPRMDVKSEVKSKAGASAEGEQYTHLKEKPWD